VLRQLPPLTDPNVLVGTSTSDDAGVYRLTDDLALVQTVDFFPPVVDDPYWYGAIAVANSLSDIYAMGARPITALNIVAFPDGGVPEGTLALMLKGGHEKAHEAGVSILGGHTVVDREPKYGLAVTGLVHPQRIVTNAAARAGDVLVLTKPLGIGLITTALKRDRASAQAVERAMEVMARLNRQASDAMVAVGVDACTDITGYGLLGHLYWMTRASGVGARISLANVPTLPEAFDYAREGHIAGGTQRNRHYLEDVARSVVWDEGVSEEGRVVLCDAQTSGGLLMAVPHERAAALMAALAERGVDGARIGELVPDSSGRIWVQP